MLTEAEASNVGPPCHPTPRSRAGIGDKMASSSRPTTRRCEEDNHTADPTNPASISCMPRSERIAGPIGKRKKKTKSRRRHSTSSHRPDFTDTPGLDADGLHWNADLENILARIDGHEQRMNKHLQTAHDQMVAAVAHMFECLSLRLKENAERERNKVEEIRKKRDIRKAAEYHIRSL
ncbi:hypothetical protein BWQ96_07726 [Gracilariopsis chorda]|uniref:Uncharacterized protein n=1 Tax=Gracilariopsis chorda TaxID=448386 RepID=A0A2V3IKE0_9FLOR|nr:hypothetical protein BWQ96_07726 [Gracilariopsis chorda]|eukprot:PXF42564.1 hypothetical protein BWQ96_07726 [Gracilariopsis chorda]